MLRVCATSTLFHSVTREPCRQVISSHSTITFNSGYQSTRNARNKIQKNASKYRGIWFSWSNSRQTSDWISQRTNHNLPGMGILTYNELGCIHLVENNMKTGDNAPSHQSLRCLAPEHRLAICLTEKLSHHTTAHDRLRSSCYAKKTVIYIFVLITERSTASRNRTRIPYLALIIHFTDCRAPVTSQPSISSQNIGKYP